MAIEITLSDFADFITKIGTAQLTKVRTLVSRGTYSPAIDFWKAAREAIQDFHRSGGTDHSILDRPLANLKDRKKRNCYPSAIQGYKRFLGRKKVQYFQPPRDHWTHMELDVKINPELGLIIDGKRYLVKLHFKEDSVDAHKLKLVFALMRMCIHDAKEHAGITMAVLDVRNGKLYIEKEYEPDLEFLLEAQAKSFIHMWHRTCKTSSSVVA